jgi:putative transposase
MSERRVCRAPEGVCSLGLHVVRWPKHRRRVLGGRAATRCRQLPEQIEAQEVMSAHVHPCVRVGPTDAPAQMGRAFNGPAARVLRQEFAHLRRFTTVLLSPSYFAASVGDVAKSTVRRSIEHQRDEVAS